MSHFWLRIVVIGMAFAPLFYKALQPPKHASDCWKWATSMEQCE